MMFVDAEATSGKRIYKRIIGYDHWYLFCLSGYVIAAGHNVMPAQYNIV